MTPTHRFRVAQASLASAEKEVAALQRQRDEVTAALRRADEELTQLRRDIGEVRGVFRAQAALPSSLPTPHGAGP